MNTNVRVRFAPSPTGYLHVGGLRTALYNYLFAKKHSGTYILRIEDTDQKRFVAGAAESLVRILHHSGLVNDEGALLENEKLTENGACGPYIQSKRLAVYKQYAEELLANGRAYRCFCDPTRLEALRAEQTKNKQAPRYDKRCQMLSADEIKTKLAEGVSCVIRLDVSSERGEIIFDDLVRGRVSIHSKDIDDQVLMKSDGFPTYHLANVVDDHLMRISHVIRGEEWLPSTPKHILLYEAFGWECPEFAHIPLLLNPDKSKLSKRQGDVAVEDYLAKGYLKEALINFVALLGWNPGEGSTQEIFSLEELTRVFDLKNVHKAGAVFDAKKLDWMNGEYIKKLSVDDLYEKMSTGGFFDKALVRDAEEEYKTAEYLKKVLAIEHERLTKLSDIGEQNPFFFSELAYDTALLHWKENTSETTKASLEKAMEILSELNSIEWDKRDILEKILLEAAGEKRGDFLWPLRVALTGLQKSPSPADCAWVLGKEASLDRIRGALTKLL